MEITIVRPLPSNTDTTISELWINGNRFGYCLEDRDRGLVKGDPLSYISSVKVPGQTAIPYGEYEVVLTYSNRFKKMLPLLLDVPGFSGIRLHSGNHKNHTEGCPLIGFEADYANKLILQSRVATSELIRIIAKAVKREKVFCRIIYTSRI
jgi:hypothetical protein